ncbi:bifunctional phosphoribosylaminoimidazolecarboxamide formyltransferase/IMP cyclohydrolase [Odoribacter sp. OttesenSCG-928-L07]|nr:bifunctional phosphoribosylaminoimidazolecarboxamide formyltransferase/IMP cyclohydrolase [Odoribacter sp. OttesenSCG-928-L07]MDL2238693.1 bifunctional phosphoribosylaminoimidazolecarboxamide formyltransferase/IMP cyclohydrolase [Bacteroidales bacterium OttesenSCG-928-L14]
MKIIKKALISIFNKNGIDELLEILEENNVEILTTGGTFDYISGKNYKAPLTKVETITGYPSILGGRVKTLHPKVFGAILNRRDYEQDISDVAEYDIPSVDLVVVDLYPFENTVKSGANDEDIIEKIDIGGISLIRAAAKNFKDVTIISDVKQIPELVNILKNENCKTSLEYRRKMATNAFNVSSYYDSIIFNYFNKDNIINALKINYKEGHTLRYGENPHQTANFYGNLNEIFTQLHGKELSYNNLVDLDSGIRLINEFIEPSVAIIKHTNACGLASRSNMLQAWTDALACDPVSAFGGVIFLNGPIDNIVLANEINKLFFEIILATDYSSEALDILKSKKNRIILKKNSNDIEQTSFKSILNGCLTQDYDNVTDNISDFNYVTNIRPDEREIEDLIFANIAVKHIKSNAITLVKNKQLIGCGTGQTSRVDALKQAITKAKAFGFDLNGAVMGSDAFFPFADCVEIALQEGITTIIQPGGSVRDNDSIEFCNNNNMKMVFTGHRHFKH